MALVFIVGKKNNKKQIVQDYMYLNKWTIIFKNGGHFQTQKKYV